MRSSSPGLETCYILSQELEGLGDPKSSCWRKHLRQQKEKAREEEHKRIEREQVQQEKLLRQKEIIQERLRLQQQKEEEQKVQEQIRRIQQEQLRQQAQQEQLRQQAQQEQLRQQQMQQQMRQQQMQQQMLQLQQLQQMQQMQQMQQAYWVPRLFQWHDASGCYGPVFALCSPILTFLATVLWIERGLQLCTPSFAGADVGCCPVHGCGDPATDAEDAAAGLILASEFLNVIPEA